jgi:hypothetical protein
MTSAALPDGVKKDANTYASSECGVDKLSEPSEACRSPSAATVAATSISQNDPQDSQERRPEGSAQLPSSSSASQPAGAEESASERTDEEESQAEELVKELLEHPKEIEEKLLEAATKDPRMSVNLEYIDAIVNAITHPEVGECLPCTVW